MIGFKSPDFKYIGVHLPTGRRFPEVISFDKILEQIQQAGLPHGSGEAMLKRLIRKWNRQQPNTWHYIIPKRR